MKGLMKRIGGFELSFTKRLHRGQKGFTLMELLIVVAILGVLAAVVIPRFTGLIGRGETQAAATELEVVQTAVVATMVENDVVTPVTALTTATQLPGGLSVTDGTNSGPLADFLQTSTGWYYTWDTEATVAQGTKVP